MTHATFAVLDRERHLPTLPGREKRDFSIWDFEGGGKFYTPFPYFHLAGFLSLVVNPIFTESSSPVLGPSLAPPSGAILKQVFQHQRLRALYIPPSIAEQLLQDSQNMSYFKDLDFVCYTGGPFSQSAGAKLVEVTSLVPLYGSTEAFQVPQLVPSKEDWAYMEWNPHFPLEMKLAEDGAYELVLFSNDSTDKMSALNHNVPGTSVWRTRDLFKRHPSKENLWQYYGRRDDIIVFSNGEKYNPVPAELAIGGHPSLTGALVIGNGRTQAALLLEPKSDLQGSETDLINDVWSLVERANLATAGEGHIMRSKIAVIPPGGFVRAGKGTVVRKLSEQKNLPIVEKVYSVGNIGLRLQLKPTFGKAAIARFVNNVVTNSLSVPFIGGDDNLFAYGLDSVKSTEMVRTLKAGISPSAGNKSLDWISLELIFHSPTVNQLSEALDRFFNEDRLPDQFSVPSAKDLDAAMVSYTALLPAATASEQHPKTQNLRVAIIGSTGSLGTAVLQKLVASSGVSKVYALNRRSDAAHEHAFRDQVNFLYTRTHEERLGLADDAYAELRSELDLIIYNAWQVDFTLPFAAFDLQLKSLCNVIALSSQCPQRPRIIFTSSVSSVLLYPFTVSSKAAIPEEVVEDPLAAVQTGYAQSKLVAERILAVAATKAHTPVTIVRLGQLVQAEDLSRRNDRVEKSWIPALFELSKQLGAYPVEVCSIDWLPLETARDVILELALSSVHAGAPDWPLLLVFNVVNPQPASWSALTERLTEHGALDGAQPVPLKEWIERAKALQSRQGLIGRVARLLPFFEALEPNRGREIAFETEKTRRNSKTFSGLKPVNKKTMDEWILNI